MAIASEMSDTTTDIILEAENLTKSFGGIVAVDHIDLSIESGTITGLIGPNGAGKTTAFNLLTGFEDADAGGIYFDGKDITRSTPHERARAGLVRTFQITRQLSGMTVMENMLLGGQDNPGESAIRALAQSEKVVEYQSNAVETAEKWLTAIDLWDKRDVYAGNLSGGQRRLLEFGRVLMAEPQLILLDEPMAGINPNLTEELIALIRELTTDEGLTFLVIEHDLDVIMDISDKLVAMHNGTIIAEGDPVDVRRDEALLEAYIGG